MLDIDLQSSTIQWQKGSGSGAGNDSVELAKHEGQILMRESLRPDQIAVTDARRLKIFFDAVKAGEFDHLTA